MPKIKVQNQLDECKPEHWSIDFVKNMKLYELIKEIEDNWQIIHPIHQSILKYYNENRFITINQRLKLERWLISWLQATGETV